MSVTPPPKKADDIKTQGDNASIELEKKINEVKLLTEALKKSEKEKRLAIQRAENLKNTISYTLGAALLDSSKSFRAFVQLPRTLLQIRHEAKRRRSRGSTNALPASSENAAPVGSPAPAPALGATAPASASTPVSSPAPVPALFQKDLLKRYQDQSREFYQRGVLFKTQQELNDLIKKGAKFDKKQRDFKDFVDGLIRLKDGFTIPPKQPDPLVFTRNHSLLYCLHQSVPHATNGYSTRSHGIATGLQAAGWKVRATTRPGFPWDMGPSVKLPAGYYQAEVDGVTYAAHSGWNINVAPLDRYLAEAADQYFREAQANGSEVIVAASNHITALPALAAARRLGVPFVYEVRGLWEVTQASIQPEWDNSERYQLARALEQQAAREADLVITLTEELADELVSWGVDRSRIVLVPNAVNTQRFAPSERDEAIAKKLNLQPGVPVIGYAGSAVAYEGLELLMEALAKLKKQNVAFAFVLVGDGKVMDDVKSRAQSLGLEKYCRFTGRVPFDQVSRYLSCMDIMPVPRLSSAVTEMVSALKPLEAMAMGKAVVLSDVSPHKTMAGNNERARLFRKGDADDLAQTLLQLINDPDERTRLGKAAREWVEQTRNWNYVTSIYAQALARVRNAAQRNTSSPDFSDAKSLNQITLGIIADQFTTDTLASAVKVVPLSPENWQNELTQSPIDALFVESAWKGNGGQWHRMVGYYSDEEFAPLKALLEHCRSQNIPTLFWNKEDPVHFDRFRKTGSLCDHVFTTDSRRIIPYLATPNALTRTASSLPFFASPKIHNLLPSRRPWKSTAAYGGTYYGARYPERTEFLDKIMSAAAPLGLTIYDRQHADPNSPYKYPAGLGNYVAGDLSYEEMIQAYKAHPVQINVNSVLDSPTMFSRRVIEIAASGSSIISGPALGMNRYLENSAHVVRTESEAAQALENLMHNPAYRWRTALKSARAVMRAHTTQHRLVQMLRTAGLVIRAPEVPQVHVAVERVSAKAANSLLAQTCRPRVVAAKQWASGTQAHLERAGIACHDLDEQYCPAGSLWLLAESSAIENLEKEDIEDLAWVSTYAPQPRIAFKREVAPLNNEWPGITLESSAVDPFLQLVSAPKAENLSASGLRAWAVNQPTLALRKPPADHETVPKNKVRKTVLIAGHDLKFIKPFYPYFTNAGIRVLLDFWNGHNQHNEAASKRLLTQADAIFCEWMLGNAIWYGTQKRPGQRLVGRFHAQELRSQLTSKIPFKNFDKVIFVGPHILRQAQKNHRALQENGILIYNGVNIDALKSVPRKNTNGKTLGFVGIVPQSKRLDLALDILRELRKDDPGYTLRIKGKRPEEYSWMLNRTEEMAWYEAQYSRLENDPLLKGAVFFDPHGDDMPEWYAGIDYALSTSDNESFHFTVADGAAAGCIPIVLPWEGASELYPKEWIHQNIQAAATAIRSIYSKPGSAREFAELHFNIKSIANQIIQTIV